MSNDVLVFTLAEQPHALPVDQVVEVVPRARLSPLPGAPAGVLGVLRLRGELVPVVDLRARLRLPVVDPHIGQRIVVTRIAVAVVGLLVDRVEGVIAAAETGRGGARHGAPAGKLVDRVQETAGSVVSVLDAEAAVGKKVVAYLVGLEGTARTGRRR